MMGRKVEILDKIVCSTIQFPQDDMTPSVACDIQSKGRMLNGCTALEVLAWLLGELTWLGEVVNKFPFVIKCQLTFSNLTDKPESKMVQCFEMPYLHRSNKSEEGHLMPSWPNTLGSVFLHSKSAQKEKIVQSYRGVFRSHIGRQINDKKSQINNMKGWILAIQGH